MSDCSEHLHVAKHTDPLPPCSPPLFRGHRSGVKSTQTFKYFRQYSPSPTNQSDQPTLTLRAGEGDGGDSFINSLWATTCPPRRSRQTPAMIYWFLYLSHKKGNVSPPSLSSFSFFSHVTPSSPYLCLKKRSRWHIQQEGIPRLRLESRYCLPSTSYIILFGLSHQNNSDGSLWCHFFFFFGTNSE